MRKLYIGGGVMSRIRNRKGMTLLEIILAFAILGIILVAFLSMFTSSFVWINDAGDMGKAYSKSQEDIETRIATGEAINSSDLVITFDGVKYEIAGGLIETNQTVRRKTSRLEMFVPFVPTIVINPRVQFEGEGLSLISITGINTKFNSSTKVEVLDKSGNTKIWSTITPTIHGQISAEFTMPSGLINDDYIVRTVSTVDGSTEVARAKFTVEQSKFVAVGNNSVYISSNGNKWFNRSDFGGFPSVSGLKSVVSNGRLYVAVGDNGLILTSQEMKPWTTKTIASENLVSIVWDSNLNKFYSVGAGGSIYSSSDGLTWSTIASITTNKLNHISSAGFISGGSMLIAAGDNGIILTSSNGSSWSEKNIGSINIRSLVSGYFGTTDIIVAIGENGMVTTSNDGIIWSIPKKISFNNFNDTAYNQGKGMFVAVGDKGLIMVSLDGINWMDHTTGTENLNGVFTLGNSFVAVGDNGTVLYSNDGISWINNSGEITEKLNSVSGK